MIIFRAFLLLILWIPSSYGSELKTYAASAPYFNYSIDYPSNWELGDIYGFVQVTSSLESESDNFKENVKVTVSDLDKKPLSLEEFDALWLKMVPRELSNFKFGE